MAAPTLNALCLLQRLRNFRNHTSLARITSVCAITLAANLVLLGQKRADGPKIQFTEKPPQGVQQDAIKLAFKIVGASDQRVRVLLDGEKSHVSSKEISLSTKGDHVIAVNLFEGVNKITFIVFVNDEPQTMSDQSIEVNCAGRWCKKPFTLPEESVASEVGVTSATPGGNEGGQSGTTPKSGGNVAIFVKDADKNAGTVNSLVKVQKKSGISKLLITVTNGDDQVDRKALEVAYFDDTGIINTKLKMNEGENLITAFDPRNPSENALIKVTCTGDKCGKAAAADETATAGDITINTSYADPVNATTIQPSIAIAKNSKIKSIQAEVSNGDKKTTTKSFAVAYADDKTGSVDPKIKILTGENKLRFFDADDPENVKNQASLKVTCSGDGCATDFDNINIKQPAKGDELDNKPTVDFRAVVQKSSGINNVRIRVTDGTGNDVYDDFNKAPIALDYKEGEKTGVLVRQVRVAEGKNLILVSDADKPDEVANRASVQIQCNGNRCGVLEVAGSQNYRAIAGFEQAGASSATSQTKPFIDFFFNTPLKFGGTITPADLGRLPSETASDFQTRVNNARVPNPIPLVSSWGQVRLSTTPEQTAAVGAFPSNLINQITQNRATVDLVQSFDFMAGLELRVFDGNGKYTSVGTGPRRAHFFLVAGAGAISPLTNKQQSIEIFNVPTAGVERDLFISRFGKDAANKKYIAFVLPERDRFLRQGYVGLRVKTFDCASEACTNYQDHFPAMFQFMFGQNEAVTGGKLKNDVTDSNGKIIGQKRSYILRVDGVFPLSIRGAGFYLYGTAMMKIGGGGGLEAPPPPLYKEEEGGPSPEPNVVVAGRPPLN